MNDHGDVMPRLIEMAVSAETNGDGEPFVFDFLLCISLDADHDRFAHYDAPQAAAIIRALRFLRDELTDAVEEQWCQAELEETTERAIRHLLEYLQTSTCDFNRNGSCTAPQTL